MGAGVKHYENPRLITFDPPILHSRDLIYSNTKQQE